MKKNKVVVCERLDINGKGTGVTREFSPEMAKIILKSKAYGDYRVVSEAEKPKESKKADAPKTDLELAKDKYKEVLGKRAHHSWTIEQINDKIAEASA